MMRYLPLGLIATPAFAASDKPFFSPANTDFIVLISFLLFLGVLYYFKVPGMITGMLDQRADRIKSELDEARRLREEAQTLLASYERKAREVEEQASKIVEHAKLEAEEAAEAAKAEISATIERRLQGAKERIASAEAAAIRDVRNRAAEVAVAAASDVIKGHMTDGERARLVDEAIGTVKKKLH